MGTHTHTLHMYSGLTANCLHIVHKYCIYLVYILFLNTQLLIVGYIDKLSINTCTCGRGFLVHILKIYTHVYLFLYLNTIQYKRMHLYTLTARTTSQWPWRWLIAEGGEGWIEVDGMTPNILQYLHTLDTENLFMVGNFPSDSAEHDEIFTSGKSLPQVLK